MKPTRPFRSYSTYAAACVDCNEEIESRELPVSQRCPGCQTRHDTKPVVVPQPRDPLTYSPFNPDMMDEINMSELHVVAGDTLRLLDKPLLVSDKYERRKPGKRIAVLIPYTIYLTIQATIQKAMSDVPKPL